MVLSRTCNMSYRYNQNDFAKLISDNHNDNTNTCGCNLTEPQWLHNDTGNVVINRLPYYI